MPRPRKSCVGSRSHISLDATANRHVETNKRRAACFKDFTSWIKREIDLPLTQSCFPPLRMSEALTAYGKHLFYSGSPKYWFAETINAVIDHFPNYKGQIPAAWTTLCRWEEAEPVERAMIMPPSIFKAAISLSLLWGWYRFTGAMLLGFHGLLRPSEILPLRRSDLVLPKDVLSDEQICYVKILRSKTSRFMLRQHARVSDELTVLYLDAVFGNLANTEPLFNCSTSFFRTRWNRLFKHLGIATSEKANGLTPKALRGSGASWLFHCTEDVNRVLWRGRWQSKRTLEHYLQDVSGQALLADLIQEKRDLCLELADAASHLLVMAVGRANARPR